MKKICTILTLCSLLLGLQASAGPPPAKTVDATVYAQALLGAPVACYLGNFQFQATTPDGTMNIQGTFKLESKANQWWVTALAINGTNITIDPANPLPGLPVYKGGLMTSYNLWVDGKDKDGKTTRYGSFYARTLLRGDTIQINVRPQWVKLVIPYTLPPGLPARDAQIVLYDSSGSRYTGYYDTYMGMFVVYYDPVSPPTGYAVIDITSNTVIDSGTVSIHGGGTQTSGQSSIELVNDGQVREMVLDDTQSYATLADQQVTVTNVVSAQGDLGRAYNVFVSDRHRYLAVDSYLLKAGARVEVFGYDNDSRSVTSLGSYTVAHDDEYSSLLNMVGYDRYMVVVTGAPAWDGAGFTVNFYQSQYPWLPGKGKAP